jgi:hypothetical protein
LSADNLHPLASSKSKGSRGTSSAFVYTLADGDERLLTYFTCFSHHAARSIVRSDHPDT